MIARKEITVGLLWLVVVLALLFVYPSYSEQIGQEIPFAFLLLAPFGLDLFAQWVLIVAASYWAIHAVGWNEPIIRRMIKWIGAAAICVSALHAAWVLFVGAKGGL